jgi:4-amino-4-deoxy-L-arabinose transferase-like glycosyltransferase
MATAPPVNRSPILALLACALMLVSAYSFQPAHPNSLVGLAALLGGTLALGAALRLQKREDAGRGDLPDRPYTAATTNEPYESPNGSHWPIALLGVFGLALATEISGNLLGLDLLRTVSHNVQFILLVVSLFLIIRGLGGVQWSMVGWRRRSLPLSVDGDSNGDERPLREVGVGGRGLQAEQRLGINTELLLILAITLLALFLRFWQLGDSIRFLVDESNFATAVSDFRTGFNVPLLAPFRGIAAFPWLYPYMQSQAVTLLGRNLDGLRALSALLGALTVPALYLLAKPLFDRKTALMAALLLATFPPHLQFSRLGINNIADPFFGTLALAFLTRGLMTNRRVDYAIGGVALGLTQYFYEGGRLLYPALVVLWLIGLALLRRRTGLPPLRRNLLIFVLAAVIVAVPIYATLYGLRFAFAPRVNATTFARSYWQSLLLSSGDSYLLQNHLRHVLYAFGAYVRMPDTSYFYLDAQPMLLIYVAPLFLLGVAYSLWRIARPGALLLLLWVILTSLGSSLLTNPTHYARFVVVFPALMLLAAVGLRFTVPLVLPGYPRIRNALAAALVIGIAVGQTAYYFGPHLTAFRRDFWDPRPYFDGQDAVFRSLGFPPGTRIHLVSTVPYPTYSDDTTLLRFLTDDLQMNGLLAGQFTAEYLANLPRDVDHAFFLEPSDTDSLRLLQQYFTLEDPKLSPGRSPMSRQFALYYAPHSQPQSRP